MAHRPSPQKVARDYLLNTAYHDNKIKETVCLTNRDALLDVLRQQFEYVPMDAVNHDRAEVLEDSLGRGTLQK